MATSSTFHLTPSTPGIHHLPAITTQSSDKTTQLLQQNHNNNHIFFNSGGFHNHISHHLLALYAMGATPQELQKAFDDNNSYQRKIPAIDEKVVHDLSDPETWKKCLGVEERFHDFRAFFAEEIEREGHIETVRKYLFQGDERAEGMLIRLFAGFYHPLIHLGYALEFHQPALTAEALAQTAIHTNWIGKLLHPLSPTNFVPPSASTPKPLTALLSECRTSKKIRESASPNDSNKIRDGILKRAPQEMIEVCKQWWIPRPYTREAIERATAEMISTAAYFAGAAQRADREVKFDFFYMHCVNASVFFSAFVENMGREGGLKVEEVERLVEMKGWTDVVMYVSRGCPELRVEDVKGYVGKKGGGEEGDSWEGVARRVDGLEDDGHAVKLVRALGNGERVCGKWEGELGEDRLPVRGDMWRRLANMAIDSVEGGGPKWVRDAGFDKAWVDVPARGQSRL